MWKFSSKPSPAPVKNLKQTLIRIFFSATQVFAYSHLFSTYVASSIMPVGCSMLPTLQPQGEVLLVEHMSSHFGLLEVGDVVTSSSPENPREIICKRILAVEGQSVDLPRSWSHPFGARIVIPKGHVWLQGDNASVSKDSRAYGPVPLRLLQGRVFMRCWPPNRIQWIDSHAPESSNAT